MFALELLHTLSAVRRAEEPVARFLDGSPSALPIEIYVVLAGIAVVALAWFLLRFGKILARWTLAFGALAAGVIGALALLSQAGASREAAKAAKVASVGQTVASTGQAVASTGQTITTVIGGLVIGGLATVLLVTLLAALAAIGYLAIRLKLAKRAGTLRLPRRREQERLDYEPVVYIVHQTMETDLADVDGLDSWEMGGWTSDDWQF